MDKKEDAILADLLTTLDNRELREVSFALSYRTNFNHGTDGHTRLIVIAKLYDLLFKPREHGD